MRSKKLAPAVLSPPSPLLLAAEEKNLEEITYCLAQGVNPNLQGGTIKNSALHILLLDGCFCSECTIKTEDCINVLIQHGADTNLENRKGKVPLDFAVDNMVPASIVKLLMKNGATVLTNKGIKKGKLAQKFIRRMPETYLESLNQGITFRTTNLKSEDTRIVELDWRPIVYAPAGLKCFRNYQETKFLNDALKQKNDDTKNMILAHPLIRAFIELKKPLYWKYFGSFYCIWTIFTFLMYMMYIWYLYNIKCKYVAPESDDPLEAFMEFDMENETSHNETLEGCPSSGHCKLGLPVSIMAAAIMGLYVTGPLALEWRKILANGLGVWARQWQSYVWIPATSFVIISLYPALTFDRVICLEWHYPSAAVGMLVGALSILIQMTPVPFVSLYLDMLFRVFLRIVLASLAFSPLFMGFFYSFKILYTGADIGPFQLLAMLVSDNDYEELLDKNRGTFYTVVAYAFFIIFIVLMVIVVLNFLIGLAVSDIQELREKARVSNLTHLIRGFYLMDSVWGGNRTTNSVIRAGKHLQFQFQPLNESDKRLSMKLKLELLSIARERHEEISRERDIAIQMESIKMQPGDMRHAPRVPSGRCKRCAIL